MSDFDFGDLDIDLDGVGDVVGDLAEAVGDLVTLGSGDTGSKRGCGCAVCLPL